MMSRNLTEFQRNVIVILRNNGKSWTEIAREMREKYSKTVTKRGMQYLWKKYLNTGSVRDKIRKGRPTIVSPQASRAITRICKANRLLSVHNITHTYNTSAVQNVSVSTVQKIMKKYGFRSYSAMKKPYLKLHQRLRRVFWATTYSAWGADKWRDVVFSDECIFQSYSSSNKLLIRRTSLERNNAAFIQPVMRHGPHIHVWGCFNSNGVGLLKRINGNMNAEKYQKDILHDIDIVGKCLVFPKAAFVFQHDLAPPHKAKSTQAYLKNKNIEILPWPGNSPDLNPIENIWGILKRKVRPIQHKSAEELWNEVQSEWYKLSRNLCQKIVNSMPTRLELVKTSKGHPIKY